MVIFRKEDSKMIFSH